MTPRWQPRAVHGMVHAVISRSLSQRRFAVGVSFVAAIALVVILNRRSSGAADAPGEPRFHFTNIAHEAGIDFVHHGPTLDPRLGNIAPLISSLGASVTVSDVNNDGWPDLYFTNSRFGFPNALYLNRGDGTFVDTARAAGLADVNRPGEGVSMGAVWGDFDNDGLEDVLIYKWGYLQLFKNMGDLHFKDVTASAGLRQWMNANGAVWFDYDRDGLLDLYVAGYYRSDIDFWHLKTTRIMENSFEFATNGGKNRLFHNLGGGRFEDVTDRMGVGSTRWTLAVAAADFNGDGWPDLFLANDYGRNELFIANGYVSGDRNRSYWYAMSKIAGANGNLFEDARTWPAIGTASLSGYERSRVLVNHGLAGWSDVASQVGVTDGYDGRAVVLVDLFNRGVLDVVIANQKQPALVYKNSVVAGNHWIAFKFVGTRSNHSAIGAEVTLETGATRQLQTVDGGMGFASQNDRRLHFGLGRSGRADRVVIRWPSGTVQTLEHLAVDRLHVITEPDR